MEFIVVLLILVFVFVTARKNQNGATAGRKAQSVRLRPTAPAAKKPTIPAMTDDEAAAAAKARLRVESALKANARPIIVEGGSMLNDPECAGGSMEHTHAEGHGALEDEDCAGGSMEHTHTEGVNRVEHARRMAAIDAQDNQATLANAIDAHALRRAVVMAEVLGKPRALRPRGRAVP